MIVSGHAFGPLVFDAAELGLLDFGGERMDDGAGDAVLDMEEVRGGEIVAISPQHGVRGGVGQFGGDAKSVAQFAHRAGQDVSGADVARDACSGGGFLEDLRGPV